MLEVLDRVPLAVDHLVVVAVLLVVDHLVALAVLAVIAAGVIWLLVFLWGVLARRKARKAAEAQREEKNEEDSNKKEL